MNLRRAALSAAILATVPMTVIGLGTGVANAHGTMGNPASRIAACHAEGPENPQTQACKDLVAENGSQPLYDWNGVRDGNANGNHRQNIPDGQLCSGGDPAFSGLDRPGNWPSTNLPSGGNFNWEYTVTAPHKGFMELYVTRDGYDPAAPLAWSDLEAEPFHRVDDPAPVNGSYDLSGPLPEGKSGRHLIYVIWQRTDSPEAFYSCSDVVFGGTGESLPEITPVGGIDPDEEHGDHGADGGHGDDVTTPEAGDGAPDSGDTVAQEGEGADDAEGQDSADTEGQEGADDAQNPPADAAGGPSGGHPGHGDQQLPVTGSAVTGLFAAALATMLAGTGLMWFVRRRRAAGAHRSAL